MKSHPLEGVTALAKGPERISKKQAQRTCPASCDPIVGIKLTVLPFTLLSLGITPVLMQSGAYEVVCSRSRITFRKLVLHWDSFVFVFNMVATVVLNSSNFYLLGAPNSFAFADALFSLTWKTISQVILMCAV